MEAHQSVLSVHQDHFNFRAIIHNVVSVLKVHFTFFNPTIKSHSSHKHTYIYTGYYNAASGQTECLRCESGRYNNLVNQSSCFRCECTFFFCVCVCVSCVCYIHFSPLSDLIFLLTAGFEPDTDIGSTFCNPVPSGYYSIDGDRFVCPKNFYSFEGASECTYFTTTL